MEAIQNIKYNRIYLQIGLKIVDSHAVNPDSNINFLSQGMKQAWKSGIERESYEVFILRESKMNKLKG